MRTAAKETLHIVNWFFYTTLFGVCQILPTINFRKERFFLDVCCTETIAACFVHRNHMDIQKKIKRKIFIRSIKQGVA